MKILFEKSENIESVIDESVLKDKKYKIKGVFSTIGEKNKNGRIYPRDLWVREVANYQNIINSGSVNRLCEWQHPERSSVDPMSAVAVMDKLYIEGNKVIGEATLLNNDKANQLKSLIDNGIKISVSSRGVGEVEDGIVKRYKLITYDIVDDPSDYNATMEGFVTESVKDFDIVDGKIVEITENKTDDLNAEIEKEKEINKKEQEQIFNELALFLNKLKGIKND